MAVMYLSKALKYLDKNSNNIATQNLQKDSNPTDFVSHLSSQKTSEILFNYGVSLYKSKKYEEAFRCLEKSSGLLRNTPIVWYYMGLSCLHFNEEKKQEQLKKSQQSDVYYHTVNFKEPQYNRSN